jgi:alkaline phosphatase
MRKEIHGLLIRLLIGMMLVVGCFSTQALAKGTESEKAKNVIMIIGDGMGPQQLGLLMTYAKQAPNSVVKNRTTAFDRMLKEGGNLGILMTHAANVLVTDSAASGTQIATGKPSRAGFVGLDSDGNSATTILEIAQKIGKSTGIITDTRITHATPATFTAHQTSRNLENEIAAKILNTGPDVMFGGGLRHWIPKEANDKNSEVRKELDRMSEGKVRIKSKRKDSRNLLKEAQQKGYAVALTKSQMEGANGKILGLFTYSAMPDGIKASQTKNDPDRSIPSLKEMSAKAIDVLSKNEKGFFLMIESGRIDWAGHYNDTGTMLHEMLKINEMLDYVLDWVKNREDTLIIVTADHETGSPGFSYSSEDLPQAVDLPGSFFKDKKFQSDFNYGSPEILDKIYNQKLSYEQIFFTEFEGLPKEDQTPANLMKIVNENTEFDITEKQAARILETEENPYYVEGHCDLGYKKIPKIDVNDAFFGCPMDDNRQNLLALEVGTRQLVTWSTGGHTSTPVLIFATGPAKAVFGQVMHTTQFGQNAMNILMNK